MSKEAMKQALDFIERVNKDGWMLADFESQMYAAITAIKEALAQTQEPVAWEWRYNYANGGYTRYLCHDFVEAAGYDESMVVKGVITPLYASPQPQRCGKPRITTIAGS